MIIYKITNKINNKSYVGQTTRSLKSRWKGHCASAIKNKSNNLFHNAISKYGKDCFEIEIIGFANSKNELDILEKDLIIESKSLHPDGYNLKEGGVFDLKYSDYSRQKMSKAKIGSKLSDDTKKRISDSHKRIWELDDGTLREKRSEASKCAWKSDDYRRKIKDARKLYWSDDSNREKASLLAKERMTDDYRENISSSVKAAFNREDVKLNLLKQQFVHVL